MNVGKRYANQGSKIKQIYSMYTRFWMNDPYEVDQLFSKYFSPYIIDDYDLIGVPDTYGPSTSLNIIPILNYLRKGSVKNIYWGLKGSGQKTKEQEDICRSLNMFNVEEKSILGGTELVGKLFEWVNPYQYEKVKKGRMNPDPQTWIILGGKNTEDGRDRKSSYMEHYCGIVKEELTNGKKVGYIFFSSISFKQTVANGVANYFSGPFPKEFETYESNSFLKGQYALMKVLAPMMRYLVTDEKCESIIIDIRGNEGGGEYSVCLASFFGDVRSGITFYRVKNDTGYSYPLPITREGYGPAFEKIWTDLANTFEGSSFRGNARESKKVVLLNSYGTISTFSTYFLGNKGDNCIGSNTYSYIIGSKDLGSIQTH